MLLDVEIIWENTLNYYIGDEFYMQLWLRGDLSSSFYLLTFLTDHYPFSEIVHFKFLGILCNILTANIFIMKVFSLEGVILGDSEVGKKSLLQSLGRIILNSKI